MRVLTSLLLPVLMPVLMPVLLPVLPASPIAPVPAPAPVPARAERVPVAARPAPGPHGVWPLQPRPDIVSGFDPPDQPWGAGHRGVDLLGHAAQPVHTSLAGTVRFAAVLAGRGVIVVDHGGVRTTYEPVRASVHVGDVVGRGDVIGVLQRASSHCFPLACLHWGLRRGADYLSPLSLVGAGPIRLLPWGAPGLPVRPVGGPTGRPGATGPW